MQFTFINIPADITKLCLFNFHVIWPNATKFLTKLDKATFQSKLEAVVHDYMITRIDYKDQFSFRGGQEIKVFISVEF